MTSTNDKVRSLILAALMVMSVFAGTVAFTGTAAAATADAGNSSISPATVESGSTNTHEVTLVFNDVNTQNEQDQTALVSLPSQLDISSTQVTNAEVNEGAVTVGSTNVDSTNNDITVVLQDDSSASTSSSQTVSVTFDITEVEAPSVDSTTGPLQAQYALDANGDDDYEDSEDVSPTDFQGLTVASGDDFTSDTADAELESNNFNSFPVFYTGQEVFVDDSVLGTGADSDVSLREITDNRGSDNEETSFERTVVPDDDGDLEIDTSGLDGAYRLYVDGSAQDTSFEVTPQTLDAEFDESSVDDDESTFVTIDSNRGTFDVVVDVDGYNNDELEEIFSDSSTTVNEDDEFVVEDVTTGDELTTDFTDQDTGDYEFNFSVEDTDAEASDSITVNAADDAELSLNESGVDVGSGDTAEITINFQEATEGYLHIGDDDVGYNATVIVVDDDEDGVANVTFNTYGPTAGNNYGISTEDDDTEIQDPQVSDFNGDNEGDETFGDWNFGIDSEEPLDAGNYDIEVGTTELESPSAVGTLAVTEASPQGAQPWATFPDAQDDLEDGDDVLDAIEAGDLTQQSEIAEDDYVVIQLQGSGWFGWYASQNADDATPFGDVESDDGSDDSQQPVDLTIQEANPGPNQDGVEIDKSEISIIADDERNNFFLVFEADSSNVVTEQGSDDDLPSNFEFDEARWNATLELNDEGNLNDRNQDVRISTTFSTVERDVELDTNEDDVVNVAAREDAQITGSTTIAPNSEVTVRVRSASGAEDPFVQSQTVNVSGDGTFNASFDFSDRAVGTNFTVTTSASPNFGDDATTEYDGVIVEQPTTVTDSPTATDTPTATPTATPTPTPDDGTDTPTPTDTDTTTTTTPGFGAVVAVLALLGAALLALRRD